jgi:hypothetical protein
MYIGVPFYATSKLIALSFLLTFCVWLSTFVSLYNHLSGAMQLVEQY